MSDKDKSNKREMRQFDVTELRVERREDKPAKLTGHAAVFDSETELYWFREKVDPGAFNDTLSDDVRALFNHDPNYVLGRTESDTLALSTDKRGLLFEVEPPDVQWANDLLVSIERGDVSGCSFSFEVIEESWKRGEGKELDVRTLLKVRLFDVGPVTFPAYPDTDVAVRSMKEWKQSQEPETAPKRRELEFKQRQHMAAR